MHEEWDYSHFFDDEEDVFARKLMEEHEMFHVKTEELNHLIGE